MENERTFSESRTSEVEGILMEGTFAKESLHVLENGTSILGSRLVE